LEGSIRGNSSSWYDVTFQKVIIRDLFGINIIKLLKVSECKIVWKSLKDAFNYRLKTKRGKSGDGAPEPDSFMEDEQNLEEEAEKSLQTWKFYDVLKFLLENKPTRRFQKFSPKIMFHDSIVSI